MTEFRIYPGPNSGFFSGIERALSGDSPPLVGIEVNITEEITKRLQEKGKVTVVGLGEMFAASLVAIATHHKSDVEQGRLLIIATNWEEFNTREALDYITRIVSIGANIANVPDLKTLQFIQRNMELVNWHNGVDTTDLSERLGRETVDIVHENYGGLFRHPNGTNALLSIREAMVPQGVLFTTENLAQPKKYGNLDNTGFARVKKISKYHVYQRR